MSGTIISIDPSIVSTGYAFFSEDKLIDSGVIKTRPGSDSERVGWLVQRLCGMMHLYPTLSEMIIEVPEPFSYARSQKGYRSLNLGSLQKLNWVIGGLFTLPILLSRPGIVIHAVSPRQWKGNRDKKWDQTVTGIRQKDEADAVALGDWWRRIGRKIIEAQ